MAQKMFGTVKWFNAAKGFGFILPDEAATGDVFVHYSVIEGHGYKSLDDGQPVEFECQRGPKGITATRVKPIG
jgi:CspA family cold shock protein